MPSPRSTRISLWLVLPHTRSSLKRPPSLLYAELRSIPRVPSRAPHRPSVRSQAWKRNRAFSRSKDDAARLSDSAPPANRLPHPERVISSAFSVSLTSRYPCMNITTSVFQIIPFISSFKHHTVSHTIVPPLPPCSYISVLYIYSSAASPLAATGLPAFYLSTLHYRTDPACSCDLAHSYPFHAFVDSKSNFVIFVLS